MRLDPNRGEAGPRVRGYSQIQYNSSGTCTLLQSSPLNNVINGPGKMPFGFLIINKWENGASSRPVVEPGRTLTPPSSYHTMSSKENSPERPSDNSRQDGDNENGGQEKPKPVGLFSPTLKHVRREIAWKWCLTTIILMAFIIGILSLCMANPHTSSAYADLYRLGLFVPRREESVLVGGLRC